MRWVHARAKNIPSDLQEEIIQESMYRVTKYLSDFHFQCALKNWVITITGHCIVDAYRRWRNEGQLNVPLGDPLNESDREGEVFTSSEAKSAEDIVVINEELCSAWAAVLEYANTHANTTRNLLIVRMVILEGHTHVEAAKAVGCEAPVVGYVVRQAQRYAREKMGYKQ